MTTKRSQDWNPVKPTGSPLTPNRANGYWVKKIDGRVRHFGARWATHAEALADYRLFMADPVVYEEGEQHGASQATVYRVANEWTHAKRDAYERGELSAVSFEDYRRSATMLARWLGKNRLIHELRPADFAKLLNKAADHGWGTVRRGKFVGHVKMIFRWAGPDGMRICDAVRFGPEFRGPSKRLRRESRQRRNRKRFSATEILRLYGAAGPALKAMILLGINGGFGNTDCAMLPQEAVDLDRAIIDWPRPKTAIERVVPLWPETVEALRMAILNRPTPRDPDRHGRLVFITRHGRPWVSKVVHEARMSFSNSLTGEFSKLCDACGIERKGRGFYALRHTFETEAGGALDPIAVDRVMGHDIEGMRAAYIEDIPIARLRAVAEHVRDWLFRQPHQPADPRDANDTCVSVDTTALTQVNDAPA